jgi:uncharacterized protein (TIGR01244 family)
MALESSLNFRRVSDQVTTSGTVAADDLGQLGALGYDLVVNLLPDRSPYAVPGEAVIVAGAGVAYEYLPIDFADPRREQLDRFIEVMGAAEGKKVHVHCAANYRVSAFYSLYAMARGWWGEAEADEHLAGIWTEGEYPVWDEFIAAERRRLASEGRGRG